MENEKDLPLGSVRISSKHDVIFSRLLEANMNLLMVQCRNDAKTEEVVKSCLQEKSWGGT